MELIKYGFHNPSNIHYQFKIIRETSLKFIIKYFFNANRAFHT